MTQLYAVDKVSCNYCGQNNYSTDLVCRCCGAPTPIVPASAPKPRTAHSYSTGVYDIPDQAFDTELDQGYSKAEEKKDPELLPELLSVHVSHDNLRSVTYTLKFDDNTGMKVYIPVSPTRLLTMGDVIKEVANQIRRSPEKVADWFYSLKPLELDGYNSYATWMTPKGFDNLNAKALQAGISASSSPSASVSPSISAEPSFYRKY